MSNEQPLSADKKLPAPTDFQSQVSPAALQELFSRDPEQLSSADLSHIVRELRAQRARFDLEDKAKAMKEKKPRGTRTLSQADIESISLESLGLAD